MRFLLHSGPVTGEERWEEGSGYSPSTLAVIISAFICAASFAREDQDNDRATFLESYADFLKANLESWTVTTKGSLVAGLSWLLRALKILRTPERPPSAGAVNEAELLPEPVSPRAVPSRTRLATSWMPAFFSWCDTESCPLMTPWWLRACARWMGFSRSDTASGPCWHRYNHDGYGQKPGGGAYMQWGQGRGWPLLTGERGHYELAAGNDCRPFLHAMEKFSNATCLLPEQILG